MVIAMQIHFSQNSLITLIVSKKQTAIESLFRFYGAGYMWFFHLALTRLTQIQFSKPSQFLIILN